MKVVKLDRRFRQFKEHGHTVALRFEEWNGEASEIERVCRDRLKGGGWLRNNDWYSYYGHAPTGTGYREPRPYWITFRNEAELTLVLLCADLT
jgi:hypothetical protein